jgi:glycosyltransferase involved in cell wall biosynthesis
VEQCSQRDQKALSPFPGVSSVSSVANLGRRRRIAHITLGLDTGGQEKLLVEFARHADRRRFDLTFIALAARGPLAAEIEALGWPVVALDEPAKFRPGLVLRLAPLLRRRRIDVVHTHDCKPLIYAAPAARLAGVPRIVHTRHFARLAHITRRQTLLATLAARLTNVYACVSQDSARAAAAEGVFRARLQTIWNGIDMRRFAYAGPRPDGPAVLVARLSPEKDIATLLRAAALVVQQQPDFRLDIAGTGPARQQLIDLTRDLCLQACVRFLGEVYDIPALLAQARLFVLSSLTEGISLTLLEAMSSGLPVVATRVGGNPEVVVDGETGLLVPASDAAALAHAMLAVYRAPQTGLTMGRAGHERVAHHFDIRHMVAAYEALYRSNVSSPRLQVTG